MSIEENIYDREKEQRERSCVNIEMVVVIQTMFRTSMSHYVTF